MSDSESGDRVEPQRRRRRQIGLSNLCLLILVAALGFGWWIDHSRLTRRLENQLQITNVYFLKNVTANDAALRVQTLFRDQNVMADARTNSIIVRAKPDELKQVEAALLDLDR